MSGGERIFGAVLERFKRRQEHFFKKWEQKVHDADDRALNSSDDALSGSCLLSATGPIFTPSVSVMSASDTSTKELNDDDDDDDGSASTARAIVASPPRSSLHSVIDVTGTEKELIDCDDDDDDDDDDDVAPARATVTSPPRERLHSVMNGTEPAMPQKRKMCVLEEIYIRGPHLDVSGMLLKYMLPEGAEVVRCSRPVKPLLR